MRSFFVIAALAALFWPITTFAAGSESPDCATIQDDTARLSCYDARSGTPERTIRSGNTDWTESWNKDGSAVLITTRSLKPNVAASGGVVSNFVLACFDKDIKALIVYPPQMPRERIGSEISLEYETDNGKTGEFAYTRIEAENMDVEFGKGAEALMFDLAKAKRLVIWQGRKSDPLFLAEYPVEGLTDAAQPLMEMCDWPALQRAAMGTDWVGKFRNGYGRNPDNYSMWSDNDQKDRFGLVCSENDWTFGFIPADKSLPPGPIAADVSLDGKRLATLHFAPNTPGDRVYLTRPEKDADIGDVISALQGGKEIELTVQLKKHETQSFAFPASGLKKVISSFRNDCAL